MLILAITLLAFALRLWKLDATSLWYDETFMLYHAQQGAIRGALGLLREDNALPLHGLLLALWVRVAGGGEFAARALSVLLGTLAVPLVHRLGRALSGRRRGGWGAALAYATLPIFVYYTQEVRMYALAIPLAAAFAWTAWRVVQSGRGGGAYVTLGVAMLAAHLYTGLLWASALIWGTGVRLREARESGGGPRAGAWARANGWLALCAVPIAAWALWRTRVDATAVSAVPASVLRWLPVQFGVAQVLPPPWPALFLAAMLVALAVALAHFAGARRVEAALWLALHLTVPVALLLASTLVKAKWSERYLLPSFGLALVVGVGAGWEALLSHGNASPSRCSWDFQKSIPGATHRGPSAIHPPQQAPTPPDNPGSKNLSPFQGIQNPKSIAGLAVIAVWLALALPAVAWQTAGTRALVLRDEWHPRPDFRGVAAYIEAHDGPEDAVAVVAGYAAHTLDYYYDGPARVFGLPPDTRLLDTEHPIDLRALADLAREAAGARRLWLVLWQDSLADPSHLIQSTLVATCHRLPVAAEFTNVGVLLFELEGCRPLDRRAAPSHPLAERFAAPITLAGYGLERVDATWAVDLWWRAEGALSEDYTVFVHLLDEGGATVAQHDHIAGADAYPTSRWSPGTRLRDRFFLNVPGGTCAGCALFVGLYTAEGRLPLRDGRDGVTLKLDP